ncbi:uncharacterized protein N7496_000380 [Penicillium cataractarum]|uniref:Uncharacterized protein n=1 Tax=Penicillium cataractarum TaxID=2100454 RepID=A0A9W9VTY0_9EURO|nr:uncharacterized protein N7496_000380 [Penicillium cataractarum]KAJ5389312.1 hypothetical protein N7496_000380 [Penicillium cataractarum]
MFVGAPKKYYSDERKIIGAAEVVPNLYRKKGGVDPKPYQKRVYTLRERLRIQDHVRELPETREEVVNTANYYWDLMKTNSDRGNTNETKPNHLRKRKAPPDEPQGPEKKTYKNRQNNRRRQESSTNNNLNPIGRDRKRNVCHICGSDTHYSPDYPDRKDPKEKPKVQIATTAGNDSETE